MIWNKRPARRDLRAFVDEDPLQVALLQRAQLDVLDRPDLSHVFFRELGIPPQGARDEKAGRLLGVVVFMVAGHRGESRHQDQRHRNSVHRSLVFVGAAPARSRTFAGLEAPARSG